MNQIIVTVVDLKAGRQYDVEVPLELELEKLLDDIIQTLICYEPELSYSLNGTVLYSPRKGKILDPSSSLKAEGIRNGEYLILNPM